MSSTTHCSEQVIIFYVLHEPYLIKMFGCLPTKGAVVQSIENFFNFIEALDVSINLVTVCFALL